MQIPFLDLRREQEEIEAEINAALARVFKRGQYILGPEVEAFEEEWASFCEVRGAVAVGNGTDALTLALLASGAVRPGQNDEVITSTLTAAYTALAIVNAGGVPVFADIDPRTYTLDPASVEQAITPRTRAIVPVHLYGRMAAMPDINEIALHHKLIVIEDAAQAHGARLKTNRAGRHGHAAAFSFYPTKNLGAYGDGGAVVSNDLALLKRVKALRQGGHGMALRGQLAGRNSRLDELQAAILRVKLDHLPKWLDARAELVSLYDAFLQDTRCVIPTLPEDKEERDAHVYHLYVIQHPRRDALRAHLSACGIETAIHYPYLLHQQPLFRRAEQAVFPVAEKVAKHILSLPLYSHLEDAEVISLTQEILGFEKKT